MRQKLYSARERVLDFKIKKEREQFSMFELQKKREAERQKRKTLTELTLESNTRILSPESKHPSSKPSSRPRPLSPQPHSPKAHPPSPASSRMSAVYEKSLTETYNQLKVRNVLKNGPVTMTKLKQVAS